MLDEHVLSLTSAYQRIGELEKELEEKDQIIKKLKFDLKVKEEQLSRERLKWDRYWKMR